MLHCLALPLLFALLPAIASRVDPGEGFHLLMLLLALPTSAFALHGGWRRHRALAPLVLGVAGLSLMTLGLVIPGGAVAEAAVTVSGSLLLAAAHVLNWRHRTRLCG